MELDIVAGVLSLCIVLYRVIYIMMPMVSQAQTEKNWGLFFRALTQMV